MGLNSALRSPMRPHPGSGARLRRIPRAVFDFTGGRLDPRITFSRADAANCATYFGRDGLLRISPLNVQPYSHDLTNVGWGGNNLTRAAGTLTRASAAASCFGASPAFATPLTPGQVFTCVAEVKAKAIGGAFGLRPSGTYPDRCDGLFNLLTGAAIGVDSVGGFSGAASSIYGPDADGYYTCVVSGTVGTTNLTNIIFGPCETSATYTAWEATSAVLSDCYVRAIGLIPYRTLTAQQVVDLGGLPKAAASASSGPRFDYDPATIAGGNGVEQVTNGVNLTSTAGWINSAPSASVGGASLSVNGGMLRVTNDATGTNYGVGSWPLSVTLGKTYRVTLTRGANSGFTPYAYIGTTSNGNGVTTIVNNQPAQSFSFVAPLTGTVYLSLGGATNIANAWSEWGNISVQEAVFTPRGLLIEETRTNLLVNCRDLNATGWARTGTTSARTQVGIDGAANSACLVTEDGTAGANVSQTVTVSAGATITASIIAKRGNTDWIRLIASESTITNWCAGWFNLATGAKGSVINAGTATGAASTITPLGNGYYRCTVTGIPSGSYTSAAIYLNSAQADNSGTRVGAGTTYVVDCAQLEVGSFATSPLITGASTATRAAETAVITGSNFTSWFNAMQGTFAYEGQLCATPNAVTFPGMSAQGASNTELIGFYCMAGTGAPSMLVRNGGIGQAEFPAGISPSNMTTSQKVSIAYASNDFAASSMGKTVTTDTSGTVPAVTQMFFSKADNPWCGWVKRVSYYPTRLPNSTLQALST